MLAIVLCSVSFGFAQTITVPSNCVVVSTNSFLGGVLGAGGKVTAGGVVTMADGVTPNGGTFTFAGPVGAILSPAISWSLAGDLSTATTTPNYGSPLQTASGATATIISYNKKLRPSEDTSTAFPLNNPTWGRSKGRVTVGYNIVSGSFSCGSSISFEIFKTYSTSPQTNIPVMVGPTCVEAGKQVTYSVDQVASDNAGDNIGFDQYYWTGMPPVDPFKPTYYSADNSSITFTPSTSAGFILKCCLGRANPWDGGVLVNPTNTLFSTTCVSRTIGAAPTEPSYLTPPNNFCANTGGTTNVFGITYTANGTYTYTWTAPNSGWIITNPPGGVTGSQTVSIDTKGNNNPTILTLTVSNGSCTPAVFNYQINRRFMGTTAIVAPTNTCFLLNSNNSYSLTSDALGNATTWTITAGPPSYTGVSWVNTSATVTSSGTIKVLANATVGTYTLTANATSCPTTPLSAVLTTTFSVKPNTPTITGAICVIKGALTPQTYTCVASTGATYTWAFPAGWNATSFTTTTNSITVTPSSTLAVLNGTVTVTANGSTVCNNTATLTIGYASTAPTGVTAGCFSVGVAGGTSVTFTNPLPGTYTATMISTVLGSTNVITSPVTLSGSTLSFSTSALTAGTYNLAITHNSGCGTATATSTTLVTVAGNGTTLSPNFGVSQDNYFAIAPSTMVNPQYEWTTCTSAGVCTTVGGNSALLSLAGATAPPAGNQVCVTVYPLGSTCKTRLCTAQGTHSRMANTVIKGESIDGVSIYPNPNSGNFNIRVTDFKEDATATLYDLSGKKIKDFTLTKGENKIENESLAKGTYIVVVTIDGKNDVKQVIIK